MIAITGASGLIPRSASEALARLGADFRLIARDPTRSIPGSSVVLADLDKPETLGPALAGVDSLLLVTNASPGMVTQHRNALAAARAAGVRKVVRISAWGARVDSPVALGRWHAELDAAFFASGLTYTSLQPHGFMQNLLGYAASVKAEGAVYAPLGQGRVCYIDSRDIGAVAAAALVESKWDNSSLELTGRVAFSYEDLVVTLAEMLHRPVRYVDVSPDTAKASMLASGYPPWLVDDLLTLSRFYAANLASTPTNTVERVLGRPPAALGAFLAENRGLFSA